MEDFKYRTKEELLEVMYQHFDNQQMMANQKWEEAIRAEEEGETDLNINRKTKKDNTALKEYNMMVSAICQTTSSILRIQNSNIEEAEEDMLEDEEEDLV